MEYKTLCQKVSEMLLDNPRTPTNFFLAKNYLSFNWYYLDNKDRIAKLDGKPDLGEDDEIIERDVLFELYPFTHPRFTHLDDQTILTINIPFEVLKEIGHDFVDSDTYLTVFLDTSHDSGVDCYLAEGWRKQISKKQVRKIWDEVERTL